MLLRRPHPVVLTLLLMMLVTGVGTARAQDTPGDSAALLFREATGALGRKDAKQATRLFDQLRARFPESSLVAESYFWQAMALAQQGGRTARTEAARLLTERALRFPAEAEQDEVLALQRQLDSLVPPATREKPDTASCVSEEDEWRLVEAIALTSVSMAEAQGALAELLARRAPCKRALRRAAVQVVHGLRLPAREGTLRLVANGDPDASVRAEATAALAPASSVLDAAAPGRLEIRSGRDTTVRRLGDTSAVAIRFAARDRQKILSTFELGTPLHVIAIDVQPNGRLDVREPRDQKQDRQAAPTPRGLLRLSPRRVPVQTVASVDPQAVAQAAQRQALAAEQCEARMVTQSMQAERTRRARARDTSASARAAPPEPTPAESPAAMAYCASRAQGASAASAMAVKPSALVDGPADEGFQLVLASPVRLSRIELIARLGVRRATPVANGSMLESLARAVYAGHPAPWAAVVVGW